MSRLTLTLSLTLLALAGWIRSALYLDLLSRQSGSWRTVVLIFPVSGERGFDVEPLVITGLIPVEGRR